LDSKKKKPRVTPKVYRCYKKIFGFEKGDPIKFKVQVRDNKGLHTLHYYGVVLQTKEDKTATVRLLKLGKWITGGTNVDRLIDTLEPWKPSKKDKERLLNFIPEINPFAKALTQGFLPAPEIKEGE